MKLISFLLLTLFLSVACNNTPREVRQSNIYREVTSYYKNDKNKEKRTACVFLFENMFRHHTYINDDAKQAMDFCISEFNKSTSLSGKKRHKKAIEFIKKNIQPDMDVGVLKQDIDLLTSQFLINHIDLSYGAWEKTRAVGQIDFEMYCNYILPYRIANEPIDLEYTPSFRQDYLWAIDSLNSNADFIEIVRRIIVDENIELSSNRFPYHYILSRQQTSRLGSVNTCNDAIVHFAMLFRDLGIPATFDYTRRCYRDFGHSMLALYWQGEWHSIEVPDGTLTPRSSKQCMQSFPKVFRAAYSDAKHGEDVTVAFTRTVRLFLKDKGKDHYPTIAIFDNKMGFYIINASVRKKGTNYIFDNMGADAIYALGYNHKNSFKPSRIIHVDSLGKSNDLNPDFYRKADILLTRKYFQDKRQFPYKYTWGSSVKGLVVEGANHLSFKEIDTLLRIQQASPPYLIKHKIEHRKAYKYIRVRNTSCQLSLAELALLTNDGKEIDQEEQMHIREFKKANKKTDPSSGDLLVYNLAKNVSRLFDGDGLTSTAIGKKGFIMYVFENPKTIGGISLQPRNDQNHIVIGDDYELLIWHRGWISLGRQIAKDHQLYFCNVPSNGLYWLHNHSRGKEEYPFVLNDKGEQYWVGQYMNRE